MGRKVLLAAVCWLTLSLAFGDKRTYSFAAQDNDSAESAPRLYRNVPLGVYASAAPYAAYSFHLPTFIEAPKTAASRVAPVTETFVNHLTDSYGNKFVGTPQLSTYKLAFPQQYVQLQTKLPEHLAQPLVAASANFQFKQSNGQFFGAPYRVAALQGPTPTPINHFPTFGQLYGNNVQQLAPGPVTHSQFFGIPNTYQQSTNNKAVISNTQSHEQYNNYKNEPKHSHQKESQIIVGKPKSPSIHEAPHKPPSDTKFQRIQEAPHSSHSESKIQKTQEIPYKHDGEEKVKKVQESSHIHHSESKPKQQDPHQLHGEIKYEQVHAEFPHYESKFQIIQDKPHPPQFQRIQEHRPPKGDLKFQRIQEAPSTDHSQNIYESSQDIPQHTRHGSNSQLTHSNKAKIQSAPGKQTITYINDINGEKTVVELDTKPSLPLLDITLLEPLKFDNPLVPQVQHFLPRLNHATYKKLPELNTPSVKNYQKEYVVQKTTSYDNAGDGHEKPYKEASKKKQKKPTQTNKYAKKSDTPKKPATNFHETLDNAPEIVYEIHAPNYKETIKEKSVSYNMKTQSEPVHYTYGSKSEKEPVTYTFTHMSNEPVHIKSVQYQGNGPTQLIYNFKPDEQVHEEKPHTSAPHSGEAENEKESSHESEEDHPSYHSHHEHNDEYKENPKSHIEHHESAHNNKGHYHKPNEQKHQEVVHQSPPKYFSEPLQFTPENINFQPILREYENNIRFLATPSASIKVEPQQHIQQKPTSHQPTQPNVNYREENSPPLHHQPQSTSAPQRPTHSSPESQGHHISHNSSPRSESYSGHAPHIHEKSKRILIQEESPDERHMLSEQMQEEVVNHDENSEEDFEKAYQDAAIGFPAYNKKSVDPEKDIFDPESYGVPRDHIEYDFEHIPLQQYQADGDEFPKETRSRYKDARDKMKQSYYTDFSISKPEGLLDRYQNKLGYYKLFKQQKPDYLVDFQADNKKEKSNAAKYSVAPSFDFQSNQDKSKSYYGQSQQKQPLYEYDYSKGTPRDNSAFASRPYQSYKSRTSFVEPQFQYGFEPISIPKLLDSELAAMASNDSPESEKPGMRKKVYKENWYIKKTSSSAGAPAS